MTQNELTHALAGMLGAWGGIGIWRGIRAFRGWGVHKWACPFCRFKVESSHALFLEKVKAGHLDKFHDVCEEKR